MDITPKELCDLGLFVSQAHARRVIAQADESWTMMMSLQERMIEAQRKRIAELEAAQRWTSVDERLPERMDKVIVEYGSGKVDVVCFMDGAF